MTSLIAYGHTWIKLLGLGEHADDVLDGRITLLGLGEHAADVLDS